MPQGQALLTPQISLGTKGSDCEKQIHKKLFRPYLQGFILCILHNWITVQKPIFLWPGDHQGLLILMLSLPSLFLYIDFFNEVEQFQ